MPGVSEAMDRKSVTDLPPKHTTKSESIANLQSEFNKAFMQNLQDRLRAKMTLIFRSKKVDTSPANMWAGEIKAGQKERYVYDISIVIVIK